jgi:hypothetical protein
MADAAPSAEIRADTPKIADIGKADELTVFGLKEILPDASVAQILTLLLSEVWILLFFRTLQLGTQANQVKYETQPWFICPDIRSTTFVGDIHGNMHDLLLALSGALKKGNRVIFLGDLVDRGEHSYAVLALVAILCTYYPDQFFLIRGNHEDMNIMITYKGFADIVKNCSEYKDETELYAIIENYVSSLPIFGLIPHSLVGGLPAYSLACHGLVPATRNQDEDEDSDLEGLIYENWTIEQLARKLCDGRLAISATGNFRPSDLPKIPMTAELLDCKSLASAFMWSDPNHYNETRLNERGAGLSVSSDDTMRTLKFLSKLFQINITEVVRAHQPVNNDKDTPYENVTAFGKHIIHLFTASNYANIGTHAFISECVDGKHNITEWTLDDALKADAVKAGKPPPVIPFFTPEEIAQKKEEAAELTPGAFSPGTFSP